MDGGPSGPPSPGSLGLGRVTCSKMKLVMMVMRIRIRIRMTCNPMKLVGRKTKGAKASRRKLAMFRPGMVRLLRAWVVQRGRETGREMVVK